jgi:uncharacterized protein DUF6879
VNAHDLGRLFETFKVSAFRLEMLPEYRVPQDVEWLRAFREGKERPQERDNRPWLATVRNAIARGATMQRVRMVQSPLTEYQRFQFSWGYPENIGAGEDIRILELEPGESFPYVVDDFWLFDNETAVWLDYDEQGRFIAPVSVETYDVGRYRRMRNYAMNRAVPFLEYKRRAAV